MKVAPENVDAIQGGGARTRTEVPSISVVIPYVNPAELALTLGSLALCRDIGQAEVVVVSDGVAANVEEHLSRRYPFSLKRVTADRCGKIGRLRNIGVRESKARTIYFIDSDCTVDAGAIEGAMGLQDCGVAIGKIEFFGNSTVSRLDADIRSARYRDGQFAYCPNLVISKRLFEELGGFDERFNYGSDGEFAYRLVSSGIAVSYAPSILVRHDCTAPASEIVSKWAKYGEGRFYRNRKHKRKQRASDYFPMLFDLRVGTLYNIAVLICNFARTYGYFRAFFAVICGRGFL